jgi:hypothetical protein
MNQIELKNKAIEWLTEKAATIKMRPHAFTPKEVAEAIGGSYTQLGGRLANEVVEEIRQRGINIQYLNNTRPRQFKLLPESVSSSHKIA